MLASSRVSRPAPAQFGLFPLVVTSSCRLSTHFVRISLAAPSLAAAAEGMGSGNGQLLDAYIKLLIPPPAYSGPVLLPLDADWRRNYLAASEQDRGWMRTYTVRSSRLIEAKNLPKAAAEPIFADQVDSASLTMENADPNLAVEIDIDFVIHGSQDGGLGPGASWALQAQPGDEISVLAPVRGARLWSSWAAGRAQRLLVLADETGVPAALSIARSLAGPVKADFCLEVPQKSDILADDCGGIAGLSQGSPEVRLHWLARQDGQHRQERGHLLYRQLQRLLGRPETAGFKLAEEDRPHELVWGLASEEHDRYVFIIGESLMVKRLRRACIEAGFDRGDISFMGYWKEGRAES